MDEPKQPEALERKAVMPQCPHCHIRPCDVGMSAVSFAGIPVAIFICGKCEKILGVSLLPPMPVQRGSSLVLPN
jgi:hypothetical protein